MPWWDRRAAELRRTAQLRPLSRVSVATGRGTSPLPVWTTTTRHRSQVRPQIQTNGHTHTQRPLHCFTEFRFNFTHFFFFRCWGGDRVRSEPAQWPSVALWETQEGPDICIICGESSFSLFTCSLISVRLDLALQWSFYIQFQNLIRLKLRLPRWLHGLSSDVPLQSPFSCKLTFILNALSKEETWCLVNADFSTL